MTARNLFIILALAGLAACCRVTTVSKTDYSPLVVSKTAGDDDVSDSIIKPYSTKLNSIMNYIIGYSDTLMQTAKPEGMLGNFVADLLRDAANKASGTKNDIAIFNNGGLRVPINQGAITRADIFKLMPFENEVVIIKLKGIQIKEMMNYIAQSGGQPVSGIKLGISSNQPVKILIGGQPLDTAKSYSVVTSDYLARGGDKMVFFLKREEMILTGLKVRDAIMDYISFKNQEGKKITGKTDGRVYQIEP